MKQSATIPILFFASTAIAQPETWGSEGEWDILIETGMRKACYTTRTLEDGSNVYIGFEPDTTGGYFAIYNPDWTQIEENQEGLVEFDFVKEKFAGEAVGKFRDGVPGGYAYFNNPAFADAFARYESVAITGSKGTTFSMTLTGTYKAVTAVRECQAAQEKPEGGE